MDINIEDRTLTKLPSNLPQNIDRHFDCTNNLLKSLEGAPQHVGGGFFCYDNQLTSLEGIPRSIGGHFYCDDYLLEDKENRYIYVESLIRGRFKKYRDGRLYSKCLYILKRYL